MMYSIINIIKYTGIEAGLYTIIFTCILEIISIKYVYTFLQNNRNTKLYKKSIIKNLVNNLIIGPSCYTLCHFIYISKQSTIIHDIYTTIGLLSTQSIGYYLIHRAMHTKHLYFIHTFHHQYNKHILPITANAVSYLEYILAYMLPFVIGIIEFNPSIKSLKISVYIVSFANIMIHTPLFINHSDIYMKFMLTPRDHHKHHMYSNNNFSAPLLNLDRILGSNYESPRSDTSSKSSWSSTDSLR